jgi:hypothetical protein
MKLSIEINDKVKVLLLELLKDQDIRQELAVIANEEVHQVVDDYDFEDVMIENLDKRIKEAVSEEASNFMTEDQVQETVSET